MSLFQEVAPTVTTTIAEASVSAKAIFPELLPFLYFALGIFIAFAVIQWILRFVMRYLVGGRHGPIYSQEWRGDRHGGINNQRYGEDRYDI